MPLVYPSVTNVADIFYASCLPLAYQCGWYFDASCLPIGYQCGWSFWCLLSTSRLPMWLILLMPLVYLSLINVADTFDASFLPPGYQCGWSFDASCLPLAYQCGWYFWCLLSTSQLPMWLILLMPLVYPSVTNVSDPFDASCLPLAYQCGWYFWCLLSTHRLPMWLILLMPLAYLSLTNVADTFDASCQPIGYQCGWSFWCLLSTHRLPMWLILLMPLVYLSLTNVADIFPCFNTGSLPLCQRFFSFILHHIERKRWRVLNIWSTLFFVVVLQLFVVCDCCDMKISLDKHPGIVRWSWSPVWLAVWKGLVTLMNTIVILHFAMAVLQDNSRVCFWW